MDRKKILIGAAIGSASIVVVAAMAALQYSRGKELSYRIVLVETDYTMASKGDRALIYCYFKNGVPVSAKVYGREGGQQSQYEIAAEIKYDVTRRKAEVSWKFPRPPHDSFNTIENTVIDAMDSGLCATLAKPGPKTPAQQIRVTRPAPDPV